MSIFRFIFDEKSFFQRPKLERQFNKRTLKFSRTNWVKTEPPKKTLRHNRVELNRIIQHNNVFATREIFQESELAVTFFEYSSIWKR